MMGRSHALLGAVGYVSVIGLAQMDIPSMLPFHTGVTVGAIAVTMVAARIGLSAIPGSLYEDLPVWPSRSERKRMAEEGYDEYDIDEMESTSVFSRERHGETVRVVTGGIYGAARKLLIYANMALIILTIAVLVGAYAPILIPETAVLTFLWTLVCAGWALAPDIDEPNSTVSRVFGPASMFASKIIRKMAGGHRQATHSFFAAALGLLLALAATQFFVVAGILMTIAMVLSTRLIFPDSLGKSTVPVLLAGGFVSWLVAIGDVSTWPLVLAVPLGVLLHLLGDYVTNSGVPVIWPSTQRYAAKLFSTNSRTENLIVRPLLFISLMILIVTVIVIPGVNEVDAGNLTEMIQQTLPGISTFN